MTSRSSSGFPAYKVNDLVMQRYQLIKLVGSGSFGVVFKAKDQQLNAQVQCVYTGQPPCCSDSTPAW